MQRHSRLYVIVRLLEHGPLQFAQMHQILGAGWDYTQLSTMMWRLQRYGLVVQHRKGSPFALKVPVSQAVRQLHAGMPRRPVSAIEERASWA